MVPQRDDPQTDNEETYDQLISLIENSQGRLAPIIVSCDDSALRQRIIMRYETETRQAQIRPYRIVLGQEPSMRAELEALKQQEKHLQQDGAAVFTVTGAELLLRMTIDPQDEQSELDKFFGYLQWTREGLREFRYPIVLWVTQRILREMSRRAPDFWSWRKAVLRFVDESPQLTQFPITINPSSQPIQDQPKAENLPPLAELQAEIATLTAKNPDAPGLATLYERLGQVYAQRISQGIAQNLEQEREQTINAFQQAISRYYHQNNRSSEMSALTQLGLFLQFQSLDPETISCHEKSLEVAREIGDRQGEAAALGNLGSTYLMLGEYLQGIDYLRQALEIQREIGNRNDEGGSLCNLANAYSKLGQYPRAIEFYQQALEVQREVGNRNFESNSLGGLGNVYDSLGQYQQAIDFAQQALEITRELGDRQGEANWLMNLGNAYRNLGQYQRAVYFSQQSLKIRREIGDLHGEALSLFNMARALAKLGQSWKALQHFQQAKQIYQSLGLKHEVENCTTEIYQLNQIIPVQQPNPAPQINDQPSVPRPSVSKRRQKILWFWVLAGVAIAFLIWWVLH
ncbi:tetratricopeptide repeat protein [Leptolyngbyaceae cyanobacterium UHCC 1019]